MKKAISAVSLLAVFAAVTLSWAEQNKAAVAVLKAGSSQMTEAVSELGKGNLEGASVSSAKAFDVAFQAPTAVAASGASEVSNGLKAVEATLSGNPAVPAPGGKPNPSNISRYMKGAAVGAAIGFPIGAVPAGYIAYRYAKLYIDSYRNLIKGLFGVTLPGGGVGLINGTLMGTVIGGVLASAGGAIMGAAILGYSPLREFLGKIGNAVRNLGSNKK